MEESRENQKAGLRILGVQVGQLWPRCPLGHDVLMNIQARIGAMVACHCSRHVYWGGLA